MKSISLSSKAMKLEGVNQMVKTLKDIQNIMGGQGAAKYVEQLKDITMKPALVAKSEMEDLVPVVTGTLKKGIFAAPLTDQTKGVGSVVGVRGVRYADWVEYGTVKADAHPYFRPSLNATRPMMANMMAGDLGDLISSICRDDAWHNGDSGGES